MNRREKSNGSAPSQGELLAILGGMSEGVIATDAKQRVRLVNPLAADLLGFDATEAHGKLLAEAIHSEPITRSATQVLATGRPSTFQVGPVRGRHLEVTIGPFAAGKKPRGLVIVIHDTTESVRYQDLRKEFVANVSHELRTPLTAIKGFAETLRDGALHDQEHGPRFLAAIEKHADQLTNLVSDLLELSHLESAHQLPQAIVVEPALVVRKAADLLAAAAEKKQQNLAVEVEPAALEARVQGNPDYLERAVANLIENAIKYSPIGGKIQVKLSTRASQAVIEVIDNGIGIPAHDLPRIFERFYRVDRSRSREMGGTGLGLSIVKHVAQAHRGSIEVTSAPGKGSTFKLKLPLKGRGQRGMRRD